MNKLLNNLLGMYKQAKLAKKAVTEIFDDQTLAMVKGIFADEQNYPTAEDITEALRSLNTNGDLSDEQYDYIQNNWEEFLKFSSKQAKLNKKAEEKESAKKDYTEQYAKVKEIMKEYGYGLSDGGYIYLISKEEPKDEGFQVKFKGDRLRVELDGKLKYSGYGPEAIEDFLKGMFYAKKLSSKNTKLTKKAGYSNNPDYFGDWFGKGQIDFSKIINPNDSGDVWMVKLWGGEGYILDVYLVKADDYYDAVDKVFEWSYENEGANNIVFDRENLEEEAIEYFKDEPDMFGKELEEEDFIDRFLEAYYVANEDYSLFAREENFFADQVPEEYLKGNKQSSKAKAVRKQAENKEIVVTYEGTNGKEYIVKAPNGLYFNEYVDTDTQHSRGAGPFETLEKAKEMFKKHRPSAKEIVATKKQATIKHENGAYNVYSESGKCLGKGYKTKEEAEKRLKQVEYFKHKNASVIKKAKNLSEIDGDTEFMSDLEIGNGMPYNSDDYDYFEVYKIHAKNPKDTYNNKYVVVSDDGTILAMREKEEDIFEITYDDMLQELRWRRLSSRKTQPNKNISLKTAKANLNALIPLFDEMWYGKGKGKNCIYKGNWNICLGGYDRGYEVNYKGNPVFSITSNNIFSKQNNDDKIKELTGYSYDEIFDFLKKNYKDFSSLKKESNKRTSLRQVVISKMAENKK